MTFDSKTKNEVFERLTPLVSAVPVIASLSPVSVPVKLVEALKLEDMGKPVLLSELTPNKDLRLPSPEKAEQVVQVDVSANNQKDFALVSQPALQIAPVIFLRRTT